MAVSESVQRHLLESVAQAHELPRCLCRRGGQLHGVDVVDSCTESVSVQEGINRVMEESLRISNGYVPGEFASNRWTLDVS
jgi:hypothetical protein